MAGERFEVREEPGKFSSAVKCLSSSYTAFLPQFNTWLKERRSCPIDVNFRGYLSDSPRTDWQDYSDIRYLRSAWLQSLKPHSHPDVAVFRVLDSHSSSEIYESVVVLRVQGITVTCVTLEGQREDVSNIYAE